MTPPANPDWIAITASPLSAAELTTWATRPDCGGVVTFSGTVRDHSSAHQGVEALEYETHEAMAEARLREIVAAGRVRWPDLGAVAVHHRVGHVDLGETAVVVVVSAPHRQEAFAAALFLIDTLKATVPMWKRELWEGGSAWSAEATPIQDVPRP
ncbi:MAG: molybdenum cofactor biosynthesis protein MoaE [Acidimicrobiales bacterium]